LLHMPKLVENTLTKSGQGSQNCSILSTSFANRSRGKSRRWFKGSIKSTSTHSHHTLISPSHLRNSITSPITNHHHRHTTNYSNHLPHFHRNSATLTPRARSLATCYSHHGLPIIEPHPHQNTMETQTPRKFLMCYEAAISTGGSYN
jgi:hypothetical protein